jgi:hypothetical protein
MNFKTIIVLGFAFLFGLGSLEAQDNTGKKGSIYLYWGWNWDAFTNADIRFKGEDYDFVLEQVEARDKQFPFEGSTYLNVERMTIPQYNLRIGYFLSDNWEISFGADHMKYVVQQNQYARIKGFIGEGYGDFSGNYTGEEIELTKDFLQFEHTDGLNYLNLELRRNDEVLNYGKFQLSILEGIGAGALVPKTNTVLLGKERYDEFHISGFGVSGVLAVNFTFYRYFFIQSEFKGGYINMPSIRTTASTMDSAEQSFFFAQINAVIGFRVPL